MCGEFCEYREKVLFRFTIGSADDEILHFWEPGAPDFAERLDSLRHAHAQRFQTSVSCEPMLDSDVEAVVSAVSPYVSDAIWIGKANQLRQRLKLNGHADAETMRRADELMASQSDDNISRLYDRLRDHPRVKWKESIKKVMGIHIPDTPGLDI